MLFKRVYLSTMQFKENIFSQNSLSSKLVLISSVYLQEECKVVFFFFFLGREL